MLRTVHSLRRIRLRQWLRLSALAVGLALLTCLVPLIHQLMPMVRAVVIVVTLCTVSGQLLHCMSALQAAAGKVTLGCVFTAASRRIVGPAAGAAR